MLIFLGGGLASDVLGAIGLGDTVASIWRIVRWPAAVAVTMLIYTIVYYAAMNVEVRKFRWITPGAVVGVLCGCSPRLPSSSTSRTSRPTR